MRYLVLISAVVMQMCLGATYSWSVYVQPLKELTGLQQGPVQIPFTLFYFIFPISMMISGKYLPKVGTRRSGMIGGLLFGGGWLLASFGASHFVFTALGVGVLSGIGAGMAYIVPITVCVKWFPKAKGLVTGVAVAGFGGGAALVSQLGGVMVNDYGLSPFQTFLVFGAGFSILVCLAGSFMRFPEGDGFSSDDTGVPTKEILGNKIFQVLYFAMFVGLAAGFAINANLKELFGGTGDVVKVGVTAVSLFAIANAAGRIVWGAVFDRMSSVKAIQLNLCCQALTLLFAPLLLQSAVGFLLIALLTGFNYGGILVLYVSTVSNQWGSGKVGQVYGLLFTSNIPASFAPIFAGIIYDRTENFNLALYFLAFSLCVAVLVIQKNRTKLV